MIATRPFPAAPGSARAPRAAQIIFAALTLLAALGSAVPARAAPPAPDDERVRWQATTPARDGSAEPVAQAHRETIARLERYLNELDTLRADFTQHAPDGEISPGVLSMARPDRLRFDYARPGLAGRDWRQQDWSFLLIRGDRLWHYDYDLDETSRAEISESLAAVFTRDPVSLTEAVRIIQLTRTENHIRVTLIPEREERGRARMTLIFARDPLTLKGWDIVDEQGGLTRLRLENVAHDVPLDRERLFRYRTPRPLEYRDRR